MSKVKLLAPANAILDRAGACAFHVWIDGKSNGAICHPNAFTAIVALNDTLGTARAIINELVAAAGYYRAENPSSNRATAIELDEALNDARRFLHTLIPSGGIPSNNQEEADHAPHVRQIRQAD